MYRIENIKIREDFEKNQLIDYICKKYKINLKDILSWKITKKSVDARDKNDVFYNYTVDIETNKKIKNAKVIDIKEVKLKNLCTNPDLIKPVIVGAGPAGIFCALTLVQNGVKPIIVEQGKTVEERLKDVEKFRKTGVLDTQSNVQFGEGGAGTFSDGKLTSRSKQYICKESNTRVL